MEDGDGASLLGTAVAEGGVPVEGSGGRRMVVTESLSDPSQHGPGPPPAEAQTYRFYLPKSLRRLHCPLDWCLGGASNWTNLQVHFVC